MAGAERAHYFGTRELDAASNDPYAERTAYLTGYVAAAGVPEVGRREAVEGIRQAWAKPNLDVWRQHVRGSVDALRHLGTLGVKLGIISNSDGTVEEQLRRRENSHVGEGLGVAVLAIIDSGVVGVSKPGGGDFSSCAGPYRR